MNFIKKTLKEQGRSQKWLAEKMGKTDATVNNWCQQIYDPSLKQIQEIADLLGVDFKELI
jgi:transcriptional regulator with XRE-family HTH domain